MKFITGDDTGICKWVRVESRKIERLGAPRRDENGKGDGVDRLCWAGPADGRESRVVVGYESGTLEARDSTSGAVLSTATIAPEIKRLEVLGDGLLGVASNGCAGIVDKWCSADGPLSDGTSVVKNFELPGPVADAKVDPHRQDRLVFGGGENDVKLWDLTKGEVVWRAKNVREDHLCLRVPVKVSSLCWATGCAPTRGLVISGSKDGKIRVYDVNAQRRPLFELKIGFGVGAGTAGYTGTADELPRPVVCSTVAQVRGNDWSFFCGNTMGVLREYDLRNLPKSSAAQIPPGSKSHLKWAAGQLPYKRGYRGIMGSIRAVDVHARGETMVAVGLGRFAYIFETKKRKMISKVYLKQKLCAVLMSSEERQAPKEKDSDDEGGKEGEGDDAGEIEDDQHVEEDNVVEGFSDDEDGDGAAAAGSDDEDEAAKPRKKTKKRKLSAKTEDLGDAPILDEDGGEPAAAGPSRKRKNKKGAHARARERARE